MMQRNGLVAIVGLCLLLYWLGMAADQDRRSAVMGTTILDPDSLWRKMADYPLGARVAGRYTGDGRTV